MYNIREIRIYAVVKGYHSYRIKPTVGDVLMCEKEEENPYDKQAVKVVDGQDKIVGHVPARPVALNKAMRKIMKYWPAFPFECQITGKPHISQAPWPPGDQTGGGATIPCYYKIQLPRFVEDKVLHELEGYKKHPCICIEVTEISEPHSPKMKKRKTSSKSSPDYKSMTP